MALLRMLLLLRSVVSAERAIDQTNPSGSLPLNEAGDFDSEEELI